MQQVTLYFWRVQDYRGKWFTTRHRATEAEIRATHPEAECVYAESLTIAMPETAEEMAQRMYQEHVQYPAVGSQGSQGGTLVGSGHAG